MAELLAPCGDMDNLVTAINNGADAVYLGLEIFNARAKIKNFNYDELKKAVSYAHLFNVKVYLTLNTLVFDNELNDVLSIIFKANEIGVDAYILQDLGLASLIRKVYPNIVLHASTQCGIHNLEGATVAQRLGFSRIILSRETPIEEIKRIKRDLPIEIEYFIQGALCVAFSGNCYMSAMLAGESGNRGRCLQLCRLPYELTYKGKKVGTSHYLSAKDLSMAKRIQDLIDAGVDSFKIEGRARRKGYVKNVVSVYREILDGKKLDAEMENKLKLAFNRGDFCEGYLNGNGKIISHEISNNIGIFVGKVVKFQRGKKFNIIFIQSKYEIKKNSVLKFVKDNKEVGSLCANDIKILQNNIYAITTTNSVVENAEVRLLVDEIENSEINKKVPLFAKFVAYAGKRAILTLSYNDNISVDVKSDFVVQSALSQPLSHDQISEQLRKGGEIFEIVSCDIDTNSIFIPKSQINDLRRQALAKIGNKILSEYKDRNNLRSTLLYQLDNDNVNKIHPMQVKTRKIMIVIPSEEYITPLIADNVDIIIIKPSDYSLKYFKKLSQFIQKNNLKQKIYLYLPPVMSKEDFEEIKKNVREVGDIPLYINNIGALDFSFRGHKLAGGIMLNAENSYTIEFYGKHNVTDILLSPEITLNESKDINDNVLESCYAFAYGTFPYMTLQFCPRKNYFNKTCNDCDYANDCELALDENKKFYFSRTKIIDCHFSLVPKKIINRIVEVLNYEKLGVFCSFENESKHQVEEIIKKIIN